MQISRLEIFGFKSFLERLVLPLEPGITGVVGPNGCGKSNIVDALRWVLGETKARSLRGSSLEDVIFNGTDKLRPLGLAEVTLTLRSSDQNFFADLVSPTLEVESIVREAAEDGMIGDEIDADQEGDVEFEDQITTTSEETGARPQLTVVTGNLGATSQENSKAGLESGGLSSEERLANQATLLQRYSWLKSVSEVQVTRRLYRSGESEFFINRVACRLKDIKELFRAVGLGARTYTIVAQGEISRIISAKPEERRMILEEAAGILGFRDRISAAKRRLAETDVNLARLNDVTKEVSRQVNSLKRQAARARNRQELKNEIARLEHVLFEDRFSNISARLGEFDREHCSVQQVEGGLETRLHSEQSQEQALRSDLMSLDLKGDSLRMRVDSIKEELGNCARQRSMRAQRIGELQALASAAKNEISRLEERRATLEARIVGGSEQVVNLSSQAQSLELQLKDLDGNSRQRLLELADRLTVLKGKWRAQDSEGRRVRDELVSDRRALALIKEELLAVSPLKRFAEEFSAGGQSATEGDLLKNASLFMDGLVIPSELVKAVQAVIAEKALFLVSPKWQQLAQHFSEVEQESEGGQSRFGGLGFFKSGAPSQGAVESTCTLPRLLDRLQVAESCRLAAEHLLGNVRLVGSSQEAFTFFAGETTSSDLVLVTPAGEVITAFSFQAFCHEGGAVQLKSKAAELEESCHRHEQGEAEINRAREELSSQIRELEKEESELRQQEQLRQAEVRQLGNALGEIRGGLKAEQEGLRRMEDDIAKVSAQIEDARRRIEAYSVEEAKIEDEVAAMRPEQEEELQQEIARLSKEYQQLDELRKAGREKLSSCAEALQKTRVELDKLRERLSGLHLDRQKLELERDSLVERIQSEYGEEACALIQAKAVEGASISPAERERFHEEVRRLKARILREGDVDPDSISRLEEEQARLDDLVRQKEDLEEASLTLKRTIEKLSETSLRRFMATFEAVRANFANLVPRLFGGGRGALALVDPQNPLETGLEIIARPPGKKLRSIELLSGGEKALCAAALIFAMFLERPSPLCVLDEVDAPLDDANLVRFLGLVKELSAKTQFIMVTHNKQSMAISDNLIGITMQEPGASKVLSVSLQEACAQVA